MIFLFLYRKNVASKLIKIEELTNMFSFSYRILAITKLKKKHNITTTKNYFIFITIQR